MLDINGLSICYGPVEVVHGVTLHIEQGKIVALIGANGAGKSSILKAVSGLIRPASGDINFLGASLVGVPPHEIAAAGIAHVMEGRHLFGGLTAEDNLMLACAADVTASAGSMEAVFQRWPILAERRQQLAGTLSGGEQQMLAIARALITRPRLLMLDEHSWGLAPRIVRDLMQTFTQLRAEGMTILLVEQMVKMALNICDYGYVMTNGQIVLEGSAEEILSNQGLQATYLGGGVGKEKLAEIEEKSPTNVILQRPDLPKAEKKTEWSLREEERQDRRSAKSDAMIGHREEWPPPSTEPYHPKEGAFRERERARLIKAKSFNSDRLFSSLKDELGRIRKEVSTLKEVRTMEAHKMTPTPPPGKKDWYTFESQRQKRQAARKHERTLEPESEFGPSGREAGKEWTALEAARKERQTSFTRETTNETLRSKEMDYAKRELGRIKGQEAWNKKGQEVQETIRPANTRPVRDFRQLEMKRRDRERSHRSEKNSESSPEKKGKNQTDWKSREIERLRRQAKIKKGEMTQKQTD